MLIAVTRAVSRAIVDCELTYLARTPIDIGNARRQHRHYVQALEELGCKVIQLPEEPDLPDSVFVEDTAIVLGECAVITRPGADSRRAETGSIARALAPYRKLFTIQPPGTVDGGDVLIVGKDIWVGLTMRSNQSAIEQMQEFLHPYGYAVRGVTVTGCLHLKSAVTQAAERTLLINSAWVEKSNFPGLDFIEVEPSEPYAANILIAGDATIYQPIYPKTLARLKVAGIHPRLVSASELAKAEGALTCCSLIFEVKP